MILLMVNQLQNLNLYGKVLNYIKDYWPKITCYHPRSGVLRIGLPRPFVAPNYTFFKNDLFYWDSYFIILGLLVSGKIKLAKDILENFRFIFSKYGLILARNRRDCLGRTQPPFLTRMIFEIYEAEGNKEWFNGMISLAKEEYRTVWNSGRRFLKEIGLSRYRSILPIHCYAEHESGWDMTSRFDNRSYDFVPIDLNCLLYQYEMDFVKAAKENNNQAEESAWLKKAEGRKELINKFLWDSDDKFFYDYDFTTRQRRKFKTLAAYYALWANLASEAQALALCDGLKYFEQSGGLANTEKIKSWRKQWDWPNGWPNQHWMVVKGLLNYGFKEDAERIARKWLDLNLEVFIKTGKLWEKYDVVTRDYGKGGFYPKQEGFAWTNAVFLKIFSEFYPIAKKPRA